MNIYRGHIVTVDVETVELPNGHSYEIEIVRHPGGAAVVAVDDRAWTCLLRQYRPVIGEWLWELPAGKIDHLEPPLETAQRELAEEAGISAARWDELGSILTSPGVFTERIHLYLAQDLAPVTSQPHPTEVLEVHWVPFTEALERVHTGAIGDAKTIVGLCRAAALLRFV